MFDKECEEYFVETKEKWGNTDQYKEFIEKSKTQKDFKKINENFMGIFIELGNMKSLSVKDEKVQNKIKMLKEFITKNYYNCSNEILYSLGQMYVTDERFKNNIDTVGGEGTAEFVNQAIIEYCSRQ